jgi:hypothetical protein
VSSSCYSRAKQLANETKTAQYIVSPVSDPKTLIILAFFDVSMKNVFKFLAKIHPDGEGVDSVCASADVHALMTGPALEVQQTPPG